MSTDYSIKDFDEITPDVTTSGATPYNAIWVETVGDVEFVMENGDQKILPGVTPGVWHSITYVSVASAGTTATGLFWGRYH